MPLRALFLVSIGQLVAEIFMFESVIGQTHAWTPAQPVYYKLTNEPSAQVHLKSFTYAV